ncbi:Uncharacterised protein [uncultured archaeon]|nr:Uncharacterised protein [uncultured archaeon]
MGYQFCKFRRRFFVIGVREKEEIEEINGKKVIKDEYPEEIDGIDKSEFTIPIRKWIEDTITDSIFPHLNPTPLVKTFTWSKDSNKEIAIIRVWQTNAVVHYVSYKGKEYYFHRHNFETVEMDEWEIRALLFGRAPPPVFQLHCEAVRSKTSVKKTDGIEEIKHDEIIFKLTNEGFGIGKNIQIGMIYNSSIVIYNIKTSNGIYLPDDEFMLFDKLPLSFKEIFDSDGKVTITRIYYDRVLHSEDARSFTFSLKIERKNNAFDYKRINRIGVFIFSEISKPTYFGVEFCLGAIYDINQLIANVIPYSGYKIKIE